MTFFVTCLLALDNCYIGYGHSGRSPISAGRVAKSHAFLIFQCLLNTYTIPSPIEVRTAPVMSVKKTSANVSNESYQKTLSRIERIQSQLKTSQRTGLLLNKVCIITGVSSLKGIGYAHPM